jgi:hypothetical protein
MITFKSICTFLFIIFLYPHKADCSMWLGCCFPKTSSVKPDNNLLIPKALRLEKVNEFPYLSPATTKRSPTYFALRRDEFYIEMNWLYSQFLNKSVLQKETVQEHLLVENLKEEIQETRLQLEEDRQARIILWDAYKSFLDKKSLPFKDLQGKWSSLNDHLRLFLTQQGHITAPTIFHALCHLILSEGDSILYLKEAIKFAAFEMDETEWNLLKKDDLYEGPIPSLYTWRDLFQEPLVYDKNVITSIEHTAYTDESYQIVTLIKNSPENPIIAPLNYPSPLKSPPHLPGSVIDYDEQYERY